MEQRMAQWGLNPQREANNQEYNFQKPYSETTARIIDEEVLKMINEQYARAKQLLLEHKEGHNRLAELLISREVIYTSDVEEIFGKRPWVSRSQEIIEENERVLAERMAEERAKQLEQQAKEGQDKQPEEHQEGGKA